MMLKEWMDREGVSVSQFAARINRSAESVRRYIAGERIPDKETMPLIVDQTNWAVTPNDFFDLAAAAHCPSCPKRAPGEIAACVEVLCPCRKREAA